METARSEAELSAHNREHQAEPWARGGAASDPSRVVYERAVQVGEEESPATGGGLRDHRLAVVAVAGLLAIAAVAAVRFSVGGTGTHVADDPAEVASTVPVKAVAPTAESFGSLPVDVGFADTSIGRIRWERILGDESTLPAAVVRQTSSGFVGRDDLGDQVWTSDDGVEWEQQRQAASVEAGGHQWSVVRDGDRHRLVESIGENYTLASVVATAETRDGTVLSWVSPSAEPHVVELEGEVFVRLDRREEVPWTRVLGLGPTESFRVRVTDGDRDVFAASDYLVESAGSDASETTTLTARQDGERVVLDDDTGLSAWSLEPTTSAFSLDAVRPRTSAEWLRWNGSELEPISRPWASADRVEIAHLGQRLIAIATMSRDGPARAWSTTDGLAWAPVELPLQSDLSGPIVVTSVDDQAIIRIWAGEAVSLWGTSDGETFERLEDVPGINRRSRGSFGWIAPDPRSSPRVRVSHDGVDWEEVELGRMLGFDASRWDTKIEAITIGSQIYVTASRDGARTMLIGTVEPG